MSTTTEQADRSLPVTFLVAAVVGTLYHFMVLMMWGILPTINPISNALFDCCVTKPWFESVIYAHDVVVNVLLNVPLALFLLNLKRSHVWWLVLVAQGMAFTFWNYHLFYPELAVKLLTQFLPGLLVEYGALPVALTVVLLIQRMKIHANGPQEALTK